MIYYYILYSIVISLLYQPIVIPEDALCCFVISSYLTHTFQQPIWKTSLTENIYDNIEYSGFIWETREAKTMFIFLTNKK